MPSRSLSRAAYLPGFVLAVALLSACPGGEAPPQAAKDRTPTPRLGMNLSGPVDWNTELPFADVFRFSRPWVSHRKGKPWGQGPRLALDPNGWPSRLEPDCWAEAALCTIEGGHYPAGKYTVLYDGEGILETGKDAKLVSREPGKVLLEVQATLGGFFLNITSSNPSNPLRHIRVLLPGIRDFNVRSPWNPVFLKRWEGIACIRFMDWMLTNGSKIATWEDRPHPEDATFSERGVPVELMVDLCNRLKADPWFCMPHRADDGYIRSFAELVKERLDPGLTVYLEYSNEVWNTGFQQNRYASDEGRRLGLSQNSGEAALRFTARRSREIFKTWEEVFGGTSRLCRILPSQAANPSVTKEVLGFQDAAHHADALAIAPYIHFSIPPESKSRDPGADTVQSWTVDQVLDHLEQVSLPQAIDWMKSQSKLAQQSGLRLVAYEAGQHLVGVAGAENNAALTRLLLAANAHPRMKPIYQAYLNAWKDCGGDLLCHFQSVEAWSKWGSWGLLQYADDDPARSPKFSTTLRWAKSCGQKVNAPE